MVVRLLIATLVTVAACSVGEVPIGGGGGDGGGGGGGDEATFVSTIAPLASANGCSGVSCHGGVQQPQFTNFATMQARFKTGPAATNPIITKPTTLPAGQEPRIHQGVPYFDMTELATVTAWINGT